MTKPGATFCSFNFVYTQDEREKKVERDYSFQVFGLFYLELDLFDIFKS